MCCGHIARSFQIAVLGLSCHYAGPCDRARAVALGARVVEKHFTDDMRREGPDHPFSMTPARMARDGGPHRELEYALGSASKNVCGNNRKPWSSNAAVCGQRRDLPPAQSSAGMT
jgi:N-acetylneuraminate synthase